MNLNNIFREFFTINQPLLPFSPESKAERVNATKAAKPFGVHELSTEDTLVLSMGADMIGNEVLYVCRKGPSHLTITNPSFKQAMGDDWHIAGMVQFDRRRLLIDNDTKKQYQFKSKVVTPHIKFSSEMRGTNFAKRIYDWMLNSGVSFVTGNHTADAAKLWDKVGPPQYIRLPAKGERGLQLTTADDERQCFKLMLGRGATLAKL